MNLDRMYRSVLDHMSDAVCALDLETKILYMNPAAEELVGLKLQDSLGRSFCDIVGASFQEGESYHRPIRTTAGSFEFSASPLYEGDKITGSVVFLKKDLPSDTSAETAKILYDGQNKYCASQNPAAKLENADESGKTAEELRRRDRFLTGVALATNQLLITEDKDLAISQALEILGYSADVDRVYIFENFDENGEHFYRLRYEWARDSIKAQIDDPKICSHSYSLIPGWYETLDSGKPVKGLARNFPKVVKEVLGYLGIVSFLAVPIFMEDRLWGFIGFDDCRKERTWTWSEVSVLLIMAGAIGGALVRWQAEDDLRDSEEKYRELVECANSIILRRDISGKITFFNEFAQEFFGYSADEILGKNVIETIVPPTDSSGHDLRKMIVDIGRHPENYATNINENIRSNGERVWIAWANRPILNEKGEVIELLCIGNDITDKKLAEEKLKAAHEQLLGTIEFLPDATFVIDNDKRVIAWNRALEEMTGVRKESVLGKGDFIYSLPFYGVPRPILIDLIDREDKEIESKYIYVDRRDGRLYSESFVPSLFAGRGAYVWATASPLYDDKGNVIGAIESIRDITELKMASEELKQRDVLLAGIAASANALLVAQNYESEIDQALEILGLSVKADRVCIFQNHDSKEGEHLVSLRFKWCKEGILPQIEGSTLQNRPYDPLFSRWYSVLEAGEAISGPVKDFPESERSILEPLGIRSMLVVPIIIDSRFWGFLGFDDCHADRNWTKSDISILKVAAGSIGATIKRRAAETAFLKSEKNYRLLVENINDIIFKLDAQGYFTYMSPVVEPVTGFKAYEVVGRHFSEFVHPDDLPGLQASFEQLLQGKLAPYEFRTLDKNGQYRHIRTSSRMLTEDGKPVEFIGVMTDFTERKRAEEALRAAKEKAESATRAKSEFLANMSHEIRTPMNAVIGLTGLLLNTELTPDQRDYVETIRSSGDTLLALIDDILDFSKIEGGKLELETLPFDLIDCIEASLDLVASVATKKGLKLSYAVGPNVPGMIISDVTRLRQILANLLSNAVKFTKTGEVSIIVSTKPEDGRQEILFAVRDTGIGIPKDRMDRLFQSFSQVDSSMARQYGGTGLGLAISKRLVELMGGRIWVESEVGIGSTFYFTIKAEAASSRSLATLAGHRALVIAREEGITNTVSYLKSWSVLAQVATSIKDALEKIKSEKFDVVILDTQMEGTEDLALEIRAGKSPPVVALGLPQKDDGLFVAVIPRPIRPSKIFDALCRATRKTATGKPVLMPAPGQERPPLRILLAEDNLVNQKVALRMLERLGYRADVAANGFEVLQALERQPYDVVLMDVQMPEMDGLEAARRICSLPEGKRPYVIAMTAHAMKGDREACFDAGMNDYIPKPVRIEDLQAALDRSRVLPEAMSALDPDAVTKLRKLQAEDEPDILKELGEMFIPGALARIIAMSDALSRGDAQTIRSEAHNLKSSSANIGALRLSEICKELELLGRSGTLEGARDLLEKAEAEYKRVKAELEAEIATSK